MCNVCKLEKCNNADNANIFFSAEYLEQLRHNVCNTMALRASVTHFIEKYWFGTYLICFDGYFLFLSNVYLW